MWLAIAGLLLAGGFQAHANEISGPHEHSSVSTIATNSAVDDHAHLETDNYMPDLGVALIVHCGADILADVGSEVNQTVWITASTFRAEMDNWTTTSPGSDPPPPRKLS